MEVISFKQKLSESIERNDEKQIENLIHDFFTTKPIPYWKITQPERPFVVRARPNGLKNEKSVIEQKVFSNKNELSYPPDPNKIKIGRANYAHTQVFYGTMLTKSDFAGCQSTALMEVALEYMNDIKCNRSYFTLGRWKLNRSLNVSFLPCSSLSIERNHDFKQLNECTIKFLNENINAGNDTKKYFMDSLEFMSEIFCQVENREKCYPISAAYYNVINQIFGNNGLKLDGLIYPSANTETAGINIVLNKQIIDDQVLSLDWVCMSAMQRHPDNTKEFTFEKLDEQIPDSEGNFHFKYIS